MTITKRFVSIWNPDELRPGESTMAAANALLMLPDGWQFGDGGPAAIFVHRWAGYHFDPTALRMGEDFAGAGIVFLSVGLRRRGGEGQIAAAPDDDVEDLALAMNYLSNLGRSKVFIIGEGIGALSVGRYASKSQDPRIGGLAFVSPGHSMGWSLARGIGQERFDGYLKEAQEAVKRGAGEHAVVDVQRGPRANTIIQHAKSWLDWWGPQGDNDLSRWIQNVTVPMYLTGADEPWEKKLTDNALHSRDFRSDPAKDIPAAGKLLIDWIGSLTPAALRRQSDMEILSLQATDGTALPGYLWTPLDAGTGAALLFIHDAEDIPGATLPVHLANALAESGVATLVPQLRRSGRAGHLVATPEKDVEDIAVFVAKLKSRGYRNIILCGHGFGAGSASSYASREDPGIAGVVLLAPLEDGPGWAKRVLGAGRYREIVNRARQAVEEGTGDSLLIDEPYRDESHRPGRFFQRASSWLVCWGPDANRAADVSAPTLIVDAPDQGGSRTAPADAVYLDANERFEGREDEVAERIAAWIDTAIRP